MHDFAKPLNFHNLYIPIIWNSKKVPETDLHFSGTLQKEFSNATHNLGDQTLLGRESGGLCGEETPGEPYQTALADRPTAGGKPAFSQSPTPYRSTSISKIW